jgi:hypothetical protein
MDLRAHACARTHTHTEMCLNIVTYHINYLTLSDKTQWTKTKIIPPVWITGSIACVDCSIGHVLQSTAWKLGEARRVGEVGYLFMCMFVSHLFQTPSCIVCTILCTVSCQALVAFMIQMCGERLCCVGWLVGPRTIKPCDLAGQLLSLWRP